VLVYRDATPPEVILEEGSASEASACVEAVATTHKVFTHSMLGSTEKPEYLTDEMFIKKAGERCPRTKCGSKDLINGWVEKTSEGIDQSVRCTKCGLEYIVKYRMEGYEVVSKITVE
jgi:DNA-directed RNA polymerase subunit RPC12/RpoP